MTAAQGYWQFAKAVILWPWREVTWMKLRKRHWRMKQTVVHCDRKTGKTITARAKTDYDMFTCAPNLFLPDGTASHASPVHDLAHKRARWDDGSWMTFGDSVRCFDDILYAEGWPLGIRQIYHNGVASVFARRMWNRRNDGRPKA